MNSTAVSSFTSRQMLVVAAVVAPLSMLQLGVLPYVVGGFADLLDLKPAEAGAIGSAEQFGFALGTLVGIFLRSHVPWRWLFAGALALAIGANQFSLSVDGLTQTTMMRLLVGVGMGCINTCMAYIMGHSRHPDRIFGASIMIQLVMLTMLFALIPMIMGRWGMLGFVSALSLCWLIIFFVLGLIPAGETVTHKRTGFSRELFRNNNPALLALLAMGIFEVGALAVWAFLERIGVQRQISSNMIGFALALSVVAGIISSGIVAGFGNKLGRRAGFTLVGILLLVGLILLATNNAVWAYTLGCVLCNFAWYMGNPFFLGLIASLDRTGQLISFSPTILGFCAALGPALGAAVVAEDYARVCLFALPFQIIALGMVIFWVRAPQNQLKHQEQQSPAT